MPGQIPAVVLNETHSNLFAHLEELHAMVVAQVAGSKKAIKTLGRVKRHTVKAQPEDLTEQLKQLEAQDKQLREQLSDQQTLADLFIEIKNAIQSIFALDDTQPDLKQLRMLQTRFAENLLNFQTLISTNSKTNSWNFKLLTQIAIEANTHLRSLIKCCEAENIANEFLTQTIETINAIYAYKDPSLTKRLDFLKQQQQNMAERYDGIKADMTCMNYFRDFNNLCHAARMKLEAELHQHAIKVQQMVDAYLLPRKAYYQRAKIGDVLASEFAEVNRLLTAMKAVPELRAEQINHYQKKLQALPLGWNISSLFEKLMAPAEKTPSAWVSNPFLAPILKANDALRTCADKRAASQDQRILIQNQLIQDICSDVERSISDFCQTHTQRTASGVHLMVSREQMTDFLQNIKISLQKREPALNRKDLNLMEKIANFFIELWRALRKNLGASVPSRSSPFLLTNSKAFGKLSKIEQAVDQLHARVKRS